MHSHNVGSQFRQLQMFATPSELMAMRSNDYGRRVADVTEGERTAKETAGGFDYRGSSDAGEYIGRMVEYHDARGGIDAPAHVGHGDDGSQTLIDGNHRANAAMRAGRLVPVWHHEGDHDEMVESAFLGPTANDPALAAVFGSRRASRPVVHVDSMLARLRAGGSAAAHRIGGNR